MIRQKKKDEKGITLIALVITIIITLIIVAISIGVLSGPNGITNKANKAKDHTEFATVEDTLLVKINESYIDTQINVFDNSESIIMNLYDTGYLSYMYELNIDKLGLERLKLGHGDYIVGDYYSLKDEKLSYVDKDGKITEIRDFTGIGDVPRDIKYTYDNEKSEIKLDLEGKGEAKYKISNFLTEKPNSPEEGIRLSNVEQNEQDKDADKPSNVNIEYEIYMVNPEESSFNVTVETKANDKITTTDLNKESCKGILKRDIKNSNEAIIKVQQKEGIQLSEEKLNLKLKVKYIEEEEDISITVKNLNLKDHSSNKYNATLMDGTKIIKDKEGKYALEFDGIKNYVQIPTIKAKENFSKGFNIEIEAQVDDITRDHNTILTLGSGANNHHIIVQTEKSRNERYISWEAMGSGNGIRHRNWTDVNTYDLGKKYKFKVSVNTNWARKYISNIYVNDSIKSSGESGGVDMYESLTPIENVDRELNFMGKGYWNGGEFFKGRIYSVKITSEDGTVILDYDLNR